MGTAGARGHHLPSLVGRGHHLPGVEGHPLSSETTGLGTTAGSLWASHSEGAGREAGGIGHIAGKGHASLGFQGTFNYFFHFLGPLCNTRAPFPLLICFWRCTSFHNLCSMFKAAFGFLLCPWEAAGTPQPTTEHRCCCAQPCTGLSHATSTVTMLTQGTQCAGALIHLPGACPKCQHHCGIRAVHRDQDRRCRSSPRPWAASVPQAPLWSYLGLLDIDPGRPLVDSLIEN